MSNDCKMDAALAATMGKLASLLLVDDNVGFFHGRGGVEVLMAVLNRAHDDGGVDSLKALCNGLRAMARACAGSEKNVYAIMKAGGAKLACAALEKFMDYETIAEAAINALTAMCTRPENATYLGKQGAVQLVNKALGQHAKSVPVAKAAIALVEAMSRYPEGTQFVVDGLGIEALVEVCRNHAQNPQVLALAVGALGGLTASQANIDRMAKAGLMPLLVSMIKEHGDHPELVQKVLMLIEAMSLVPAHAKGFASLSAVAIIQNVLKKHEDHGDIQRIGKAAIAAIQNAEALSEAEKKRREEEEKRRLAALAEAERMRREEEERRAREEAERRRRELEAMEALRLKKQAEDEAAELLRQKLARERAAAAEALRLKRQQEEEDEERRLAQERRDLALKREQEYLQAMKEAEDEELELQEERRRLKEERAHALLQAQQAQDASLSSAQEKNRLAKLQAEQAQAKARADAEKAHLASLVSKGQIATQSKEEQASRVRLGKSARELFGDDEDDSVKKKRVILDKSIKDFLLRGAMLQKHSNSANPRKRFVFVNAEFTKLCWKDPKKPLAANQYMLLSKLASVEEGWCTPQLMRKNLFGKKLAGPEDCCFAVFGSALAVKNSAHARETRLAEMSNEWESRSIDLECESANQAAQWKASIKHVIEWAASEKVFGKTETVKMNSNPMGEDGEDFTNLVICSDED